LDDSDPTYWTGAKSIPLGLTNEPTSNMGLLERLRRRVQLWMLVVAILATGSVTTAIFIAPSYLGPKPDFKLEPVQFSEDVMAGHGGLCCSLLKVSVTSLNGFTGIISFTASAPSGLNVSLAGTGSPNPVAILGRNDTLKVSALANSSGNYSLTVTGSYRELSHSVTLIVIAQSITFSANPDPIVIPKTGSANSVLTVGGVNGFSGTVRFYSYGPNGCCYLHPNPVFLPLHETTTVTITTQPPGTGSCLPSVMIIDATSDVGVIEQGFNTVCG
jgi:hypothetical protein